MRSPSRLPNNPYQVCTVQYLAAAVGEQRGTRRAAHKDHDRSEGLCRGWPGHLEQPPRRPADFITVQRYICEKNSKFIYLAASALEVFSNWALYKLTDSFIHSFNMQGGPKMALSFLIRFNFNKC